MRKGEKQPALGHNKAEASHLDNLLDEALWETFPASDPIAITIDKPSRSVAPAADLFSRDNPSTADLQEVVVASPTPVLGFFDANLWALRQISSYFDWWSHVLGGRK